MGVVISKPAINLREQLTELKAQQGYEERQFHFDNLVTNGTFDTDLTSWNGPAGGNTTATWNSGVVDYVRTSGDTAGDATFWQVVTTEVGKEYVVSWEQTSYTSGFGYLQVTNGSGTPLSGTSLANYGDESTTNTTGTFSVNITATSTTTQLNFRGGTGGTTISLDNVSVYTSDGADVAFTMPKGWKPLHVYDDGVLQREGSAEDYEVTFDGFNYYVKPTVANPGARNTVIGVRA